MTSSKPRKKILIAVIAGAVLLAGALTAFFIWLKAYTYVWPIDLNDYVSVVYEGYSEVGTGEVVFDKEAFLEEYAGKLRWADRADREKGDPAEALLQAMEAEVQPVGELVNGELTNGDDVRIRWEGKSFRKKIANAEISAESFHTTVKGLKEPQIFDAFEQLEIKYDGLDGEGRLAEFEEHAGYERQYGLFYTITYTSNPEGYIENGDEVHVSIGSREKELQLIRNYGVKPKEMYHVYTVTGLTTYTTFDPFEHIRLVFKGRDGAGIIQDFYNDSTLPAALKLGFRFEPNKELHNGDEVLVTAFFGPVDRITMAKTYGMLPDPMQKKFIVSGLSDEDTPSPGQDDQGGDQPSPDEQDAEAFGILTGSVYINETFGLKAILPSNFTAYGKGHIPSSVIGGLNDLYAEAGQTETLGVRIQRLTEEEKTKSAKEILQDYSQEIFDMYMANGLSVAYKLTEEQFAGKTYACLDITAQMKVVIVVMNIRHKIFVRKEGDHMIAVSVMTGDNRKIDQYCAIFEELK